MQHERPPSVGVSPSAGLGGTVFIHPATVGEQPDSHEAASLQANARMLAELKGFRFACGGVSEARAAGGPSYVLPNETLDWETAQSLGVTDENDLFGGVIPQPFVGTKAITHPLAAADAFAPAGWSEDFSRQVRGSVLRGYTAFTAEDAARAAELLLPDGPVRVKPSWVSGGGGQTVIQNIDELQAALVALDADALSRCGLALEENLEDVTTYSVGQVRVGDAVATYWGTQSQTRNNRGAAVYGGSDLVVVRGEFEDLLGLDLADEVRIAIAQANIYDAAASNCFPQLLASRRNYDVARGVNASGEVSSGVLEQSWRVGGASGAELAALLTFRMNDRLQVVRASTVESYGDCSPPEDAAVCFRGNDRRVGQITKYTMVRPYVDDTGTGPDRG